MPYAKLGPAVGLSQAAVRQRVQRLIDSGAMQVVAVTDPLAVGFTVAGHGRPSTPTATCGPWPTPSPTIDEVDYVVITSGRFDLWSRSCARAPRSCSAWSTTRCAPSPACNRAEIFTYLHLAKQSYSWGTR